MRVELAYGKNGLEMELPGEGTTVLEPSHSPGVPCEEGALRQAFRNPRGTPPLRELARPGQTVAISVCDITRPMPSSRVLPVLLAELEHVPRDQISILVATGTHRSNTVEELEGMLGAEVVRNYPVINHQSFRTETLTHRGTLASGIPVWLNSIWLESDVKITTGFVEPHFFAGFSGGPKLVAPGLAGFDTIMKLHSAPLIAHPRATWGITHGNPIHDAIREVAALSGVDFSLDVTLNRDHEITSVHAGEIFKSHGAACRFAKKTAMQPVARPFDVVVTTNSGYPLDLNLYQSVKGMSAAARIVRRGGAIVCAAECSDGIPEHGEYRKLLASTSDPSSFLDRIRQEDVTTHDQWQVQIQSQIQLKARVLLKSDGLTPRQIRSAHLEPVQDLEATVLELLDEYGPDARLGVLPQGPQTIPYLSAA